MREKLKNSFLGYNGLRKGTKAEERVVASIARVKPDAIIERTGKLDASEVDVRIKSNNSEIDIQVSVSEKSKGTKKRLARKGIIPVNVPPTLSDKELDAKVRRALDE